MKLSPQPVQAYLSRGLFVGALVSLGVMVASPPPARMTAFTMFALCAIISTILGFVFWRSRPAKVGAIGSIILVVAVTVIFVWLGVVLFKQREGLKDRVMELETAVQDVSRDMGK
jgi:hypothetical protein